MDRRVAPYLAQRAGGGEPGWLARLRDGAADALRTGGFPHHKTEAWRYTDLTRMLRTVFVPAQSAEVAVAALDSVLPDKGPGPRLVLVNGRFAPALSRLDGLPAGASLTPLAGALASERLELGAIAPIEGAPMAALNTLLMRDGAVLDLDDGVALDAPIELVCLAVPGATPAASHPRVLIRAGAGSRATVIETFVGLGPEIYWTNRVTEVIVGRGAAIDHVTLQDEGQGAFHTGLVAVRLDGNSAYRSLVASTGARLARNEYRVAVEGSGAECRLSGATLARSRQHIDNTTVVDHRHPGSSCREVYKSVVDDRARTVFQGLIRVAPGAQKTDAQQICRNVLMSPLARAEVKPELEIHADDVRCSHGATVGEIDADAIFYLRSRGIPLDEARGLMIRAFVAEIVEGADVPAVARRLDTMLDTWLAAGRTLGQAA